MPREPLAASPPRFENLGHPAELVNLGIVDQYEMPVVSKVLSAAALTYVAATLQSLLTLLYYVSIFTGNRD